MTHFRWCFCKFMLKLVAKDLEQPIWIFHSLTKRSLQWSEGEWRLHLKFSSMRFPFGKIWEIYVHLKSSLPIMSSRTEGMGITNIFSMLVSQLICYQKFSTLAAPDFKYSLGHLLRDNLKIFKKYVYIKSMHGSHRSRKWKKE